MISIRFVERSTSFLFGSDSSARFLPKIQTLYSENVDHPQHLPKERAEDDCEEESEPVEVVHQASNHAKMPC